MNPPTPLPALAITSVRDTVFFNGSGSAVVVFDVSAGYELLDPVTANPAQWLVLFNHTIYRGIDFVFDGGAELTIYFDQYGFTTGPNWISYAADPADIQDTQGRMLGVVDSQPF